MPEPGQAPYFARFKIGDAEAVVVSDGPLPLGDPVDSFLGLGQDEIRGMLAAHFLPTDEVVLEQNALLINTGGKLVLFESGVGSSRLYGPTTGHLLDHLKQAGIDPKDVDAVVLSHAHADHCGGIVAEDGSPNFPNAQIYLTQADYDFWTDESNVPAMAKDIVVQAKRNLVPNRDRIRFIEDGQEFLPGIQALAAPGHTVGHTIFVISSGGKSLAYVADLAHHPVLLLKKPRMEFAYDTDPKQSAATRVRVLEMLAGDRTPLLAYHFPWPGVGHVAKAGDGFRYYPAPLSPMQAVL